MSTGSKLEEVEVWRRARKPYQLQCERPNCHFCWYPRNPKVKPKVCPKCKSYFWDKNVGFDYKRKDEVEEDEKRRGL